MEQGLVLLLTKVAFEIMWLEMQQQNSPFGFLEEKSCPLLNSFQWR